MKVEMHEKLSQPTTILRTNNVITKLMSVELDAPTVKPFLKKLRRDIKKQVRKVTFSATKTENQQIHEQWSNGLTLAKHVIDWLSLDENKVPKLIQHNASLIKLALETKKADIDHQTIIGGYFFLRAINPLLGKPMYKIANAGFQGESRNSMLAKATVIITWQGSHFKDTARSKMPKGTLSANQMAKWINLSSFERTHKTIMSVLLTSLVPQSRLEPSASFYIDPKTIKLSTPSGSTITEIVEPLSNTAELTKNATQTTPLIETGGDSSAPTTDITSISQSTNNYRLPNILRFIKKTTLT